MSEETFLGFDVLPEAGCGEENFVINVASFECWSAEPHTFSIVSAIPSLAPEMEKCPYCKADVTEVVMEKVESPDGNLIYAIKNEATAN